MFIFSTLLALVASGRKAVAVAELLVLAHTARPSWPSRRRTRYALTVGGAR